MTGHLPGTTSRRHLAGDAGSLPLAMLLTLVGVMVSALLVPMVLNQIRSTREDMQRVHALHAAQAGLDVALGHIRAADDGAGNGVLARLPCGPLAGVVGAGGTARYQVTIDYLATDPSGRSDSWVAANRIACTTGSGPSVTPGYALLRAEGTDQPTGAFTDVRHRSLRATYTFQTTGQHNGGGLIHVFRTGTTGTDLCLDAGSGTPAAGTNLQVQPCQSGSDGQRFAYRPNLTLVLVASATTVMPLGMCLEAGSPHAAGQVVQARPCAVTTRPQQQWIFNDMANFEGTADGITVDGTCFNVQTRGSPGSFVVLGDVAGGTCRQGPDEVETFVPEAAVGTGAAGPAAHQLVNFGQFSRCLNVTEQNVRYAYLTAWPCQQATDPANVVWSQRWSWPTPTGGATGATGRVSTTAPTGAFCLRSPGSTAAGRYVTVAACPGGATPRNMTWTVFGNTGSYPTSYRVADGYGYCLSPTDPTAQPADLYPHGYAISKLVVAPCAGSTLQKWNAPPNALQALPLTDVGER